MMVQKIQLNLILYVLDVPSTAAGARRAAEFLVTASLTSKDRL